MNQPVTAYGLGHPTVEMPKDAPQVMKNLAWKSRTNFLPLILDTFSQVMKVDGYIEANGVPSSAWDRVAGERDGRPPDRRAPFRAAVRRVVRVDPARGQGAGDPRLLAAPDDRDLRGPDVDEWPMMALDVNGPMLRLFDEENVYHIGIENYPRTGLGAQSAFPTARSGCSSRPVSTGSGSARWPGSGTGCCSTARSSSASSSS
jgi:hypothetical protein